MSLKDAFEGIREAQELERLDAQTPKRLDVQASESLDAQEPGRSDAQTVRGLDAQEAKRSGVETSKRPNVQAPKRSDAQAPKRLPLPLQATGKSSHPDFEKATIYVRSDTRRRAWRKWEDAEGGDFSDLVQQLLEQYLDA